MTIALIVVCTLLGIAAGGSGVGKLTGNPKVMESLHSVGVTDSQARLLGVVELLGAAGLLVGIAVPALGAAAAIGLALYFLGAVSAHLRAKHVFAEMGPAAVILVVAVVATVLQLQR